MKRCAHVSRLRRALVFGVKYFLEDDRPFADSQYKQQSAEGAGPLICRLTRLARFLFLQAGVWPGVWTL